MLRGQSDNMYPRPARFRLRAASPPEGSAPRDMASAPRASGGQNITTFPRAASFARRKRRASGCRRLPVFPPALRGGGTTTRVAFIAAFRSALSHFHPHVSFPAFKSGPQSVLRSHGGLKRGGVRAGQADEELTVRRAGKAEFGPGQHAFSQGYPHLGAAPAGIGYQNAFHQPRPLRPFRNHAPWPFQIFLSRQNPARAAFRLFPPACGNRPAADAAN